MDPLSPRDEDEAPSISQPAIEATSAPSKETTRLKINGKPFSQPGRLRAFARFDSESQPLSTEVLPSGMNGESPPEEMDGSPDQKPEPMWMEMEAGPSDYWRGSPSISDSQLSPPPAAWRQASSETWPGDPEDGPSDVWTGRELAAPSEPDGIAPAPDGRNGYTTPTRSYLNTPSGTPGLNDEVEYENRMRAILQPPSLANGHSEEPRQPERLKDDDSREKALGHNEFADDQSDEVVPLQGYDRSLARSTSTISSSVVAERLLNRPSPFKRSSASYLHPSISRLRSHLRTTSTATEASSSGRPTSLARNRLSSHFSQLSLAKSDSTAASPHPEVPSRPGPRTDQSPAFAFHPLRTLSRHLFSTEQPGSRPAVSRKASSVLGIPSGQAGEANPLGRPTVMDVRDVIAVGTDTGRVLVYGFDQKLQHVLQNDPSASSGPVTAVTTSPDNTFVAVGHATGNIHLYDLSRPAKPARTNVALSVDQVLSGQKEGHLKGSRILHIGFVGARHTSIVSGDEHGRAFWWSLGKVIGVESNDVVRMLGSYPERESRQPTVNGSDHSRPSKKPTTLFAVAPLPLGARPYAGDEFNFTALQTSTKLVIVGMKPTARTWYRKMRTDIGGELGGLRGCAQWSIATDDGDRRLAYSWGNTLGLLRIKVPPTPTMAKPAKPPPPEFFEGATFEASGPVIALQWYDPHHIVLATLNSIFLVDTRDMRPVETCPLQSDLLTSNPFYSNLGQKSQPAPEAFSSSVRAHRGKVFILTRTDLQVASLLHWNDRILARVHQGDFLDAIQVALAYYEDRAPGNTINLPQDRAERRKVVGTRVKELIRSSLEWAFSEDRMRDDTHYSVDGRGVDLTGLFEGLATSCIDASLALGDTTFLFEDEYEYYANAGIQNIFLDLLQPYIFDGRIRDVPPTIVQALISMHETQGDLDSAEAIIWHVDPMSLDINQVVTLCEAHGLWDALIHVYTRTMRDYVAPLVKLVGVIIGLMRERSKRLSMYDDFEDETGAFDAYKLFGYLEMVLSGQSYPSGEALLGPEGVAARASVYDFLFANQLVQWPEGSDGTLVPALDNSTPYPYLDLILQFDAEAFLHAIDLAFEDSYLNDAAISRQSIVNILLGVMSQDRFSSDDIIILHIFVARNLPKYPQFLSLPASTLHQILRALAGADDSSTLEDRQLATEFLLSAYTPPDIASVCELFEQAGFYRILRSIYRQERQWRKLILAHVNDPDLDLDLFDTLDALLAELRLDKAGKREVEQAIESVLSRLLELSVRSTAIFLDKHAPGLHNRALGIITADLKKLAYLRVLLDPSDEEVPHILTSIDSAGRLKYVSLLTAYDSSSVIAFLDRRGPAFFTLLALVEQFREAEFTEGLLWALDRRGDSKAAFDVTESVFQSRSADLGQALMDREIGDAHLTLVTLTSTCHMAVRLCQEHSKVQTTGADDMWFDVLHGIMESVHSVGVIASQSDTNASAEVMNTLRSLVQYTLQSLISSSSSTLSFPRLFKRLVDESTMASGKAKGRAYSEFRTILTGMLDSYRSEGEMLSMTTRMVEEDLFLSIEEVTKRRQMGWRPAVGVCGKCGKDLVGDEDGEGEIVLASGQVRHKQCRS